MNYAEANCTGSSGGGRPWANCAWGAVLLVSLAFWTTLPCRFSAAIGYFDADFAIVSSAPLGQPADLLHPIDAFAATWDFGGIGRASGVVVGSNWILTGQHVANDPNINIHTGTDNSITYRVARNAAGEPQIFSHPSLDIGLIQIALPDGTAPNLPAVPIGLPLQFGSVPVTVGGYGAQRVFDSVTGKTDGTVLGGDELRWGRNVVHVGSQTLLSQMDKPLDSASAPNPLHLKYEGQPMGGDSGGDWFQRVGWHWELIGITSTGGVMLPFPAAPAESSAPKVADESVQSWIRQHMGDTPPAAHSVRPRPQETIRWTGPANGNWGAAPNWQDVDNGQNRLPAFSATRADIVVVDSPTGPAVTGHPVPLMAGDLFVGRTTSPENAAAASFSIQSAGSLSTDSVFLGADAGSFGVLRLNGGALKSVSQYVGYQGRGSVQHTGGTNTTVTLSVGKSNRNSEAASLYFMAGVHDVAAPPQLWTSRLVIGEDAGSLGQFSVFGGPHASILSTATIVGDRGSGKFDHHTGTHTVAEDLVLGSHLHSSGAYSLSGNALLRSARTTVGFAGAGTFYQSGGVHETDELQINPTGTYSLVGGTLRTNYISGAINFSGSNATLSTNGLGNYAHARFIDAQNAALEIGPDSLALLPDGQPFAMVVNYGTLPPHFVGHPLTFSSGGFRGFGDISDPVSISGNAHIAATPGTDPLRLVELHVADDAEIRVEPGAVFEISTKRNTPLVIDRGAPRLSVNDGTLMVAQQFGETGLQVSAGAQLSLHTSATLANNSLQFFCHQADIRVEPGGALTATGGINFAVGRRSMWVDGTLRVTDGIGPLDIRHLGLNSTEEITLQLSESSRLEFDLTASQHDAIRLTRGGASLHGQLALNVTEGFHPALGQVIDIIVADYAINGVFDLVSGHLIDLGFAESRDEIGLAVVYTGVDESKVVRLRASLIGDVDFDNSVDLEDYHQVLVHMGTQQATWEQGDFNGDGRVAVDDFRLLIENFGLFLNPNAGFGDFDFNGVVNAADYGVWRNSLGEVGVALAADGNGDRTIDALDYEIWRTNFGRTSAATTPLVAIPEPTTVAITACCLVLTLLSRRHVRDRLASGHIS